MTGDDTFDLDELDADTRAECEARAAELGVSVEDYVNDRLLLTLLMTQAAEAADEPEAAPIVVEEPPMAPTRETQAMRQRLDSMDRRLNVAVGTFENTIGSIEGSLSSLVARADDAEERGDHHVARIDAALADLHASITALDPRFDQITAQHETLSHQHVQFREQTVEQIVATEHRLDQLEDATRHGDRALLETQDAITDLRFTTADNIRAVSTQVEAKLSDQQTQLETALTELEVRTGSAQAEAVRRADANAQRILTETRTLCAELESELTGAIEELQAEHEHARANASQLHNALAAKIIDSDRRTATAIEQRKTEAAELHDAMHAKLTDNERRTATAIEQAKSETAELHNTLSAKLTDSERRAAAAIEHAKTEAAGQTETVRGELSRLRCATEDAQTALRTQITHSVERQHAALLDSETKIAAHLADLRERQAGAGAQIKLIDASLAKLGNDLTQTRATLDTRIDVAAAASNEGLDAAHRALLHHSDALAGRIEEMHRALSAAQAATSTEMSALDQRTRADFATMLREHRSTVAALHTDIEKLATLLRAENADAHGDLDRSLADLQTEHKGALARLKLIEEMLETQALAQSTANATTASLGERFSRAEGDHAALSSVLQQALAGMIGRIDAIETQATGAVPALAQLETLLARLDEREAAASMAADDLHDVAERMMQVHRRLQTLEARADTTQMAGEALDQLRAEIDERLYVIEQRGVSALAQLSQTVALLGKRAKADDGDEALARSA